MMKKILPVAVAALTLVLSADGTFAEPPDPAAPSDKPGIDYDQLQRLQDTEMATVTGGAWWSGACTGAIHAAGASLVVAGYMYRNGLMEGAGLFALRLECV